jgi:hypothetical protein
VWTLVTIEDRGLRDEGMAQFGENDIEIYLFPKVVVPGSLAQLVATRKRRNGAALLSELYVARIARTIQSALTLAGRMMMQIVASFRRGRLLQMR